MVDYKFSKSQIKSLACFERPFVTVRIGLGPIYFKSNTYLRMKTNAIK